MLLWGIALWSALLACEDPQEPPCGMPRESTITAGPGGGGNVLLILLDDVGTEQLAAFEVRSPQALTPTIDCLCERGLRFSQTWATPVCSPSRAALLTGRLADRTHLGWNVEEAGQLPQSEVTLAEMLREAGYRTGLVGKWHLDGWQSPEGFDSPRKQGFDTFTGTMGNIQEVAAAKPRKGARAQYDAYWRIVDGQLDWTTRYATTVEVDDALAFLETAEPPWFLMLSLHASHLPAHRPPEGLPYTPLPAKAGDPALFRAALEAADRELSRLFREMDQAELADTTVVLLGDNGTAPYGVQPPTPGRFKGSLYEGGVRVPLIVAGPHVPHPGSVATSLAHITDLWPTLAEIAGVQRPEIELEGTSLLPRMLDPDLPGPAYIRTLWGKEELPYDRAIRDERYKLLSYGDGRVSLFDLLADPGERSDLLAVPLSDQDLGVFVRLALALGTPPAQP